MKDKDFCQINFQTSETAHLMQLLHSIVAQQNTGPCTFTKTKVELISNMVEIFTWFRALNCHIVWFTMQRNNTISITGSFVIFLGGHSYSVKIWFIAVLWIFSSRLQDYWGWCGSLSVPFLFCTSEISQASWLGLDDESLTFIISWPWLWHALDWTVAMKGNMFLRGYTWIYC